LNNPFVHSVLKNPRKLKREFYTRPVVTVAPALLGKILVKKVSSDLTKRTTFLVGRIVEVEAYDGSVDQAAHSYIGKTKRNEIMFGQGGHLYVYFTYGKYFCSNIVTGKVGQGNAVLLRAIEPISGYEEMIRYRFNRDLKNNKEKVNLTNGPGKICQAFDINMSNSGTDLTENEIFILDQPKVNKKDIVITKRIGITKSRDLLWRFYIKDNLWVSAK
jgi:DNA-3-methyladenine glycosylase